VGTSATALAPARHFSFNPVVCFVSFRTMGRVIQYQIDYLAFVAVSVLLFITITWSLRKLRPVAAMPRFTWPLLLVVLAGSWWPIQERGNQAKQEIETMLDTVAPTYAMELSRLGHAKINIDTAADDPTYRALVATQKKWLKLNSLIHEIYTMRKLPDGKNVLMVDSDSDYNRDGVIDALEQGSPIGTVYETFDAALEQALVGRGGFDPVVINDNWGSWVGAWAPMLDDKGNIEAVLRVDYDAMHWFRAIFKARLSTIFIFALIVLSVGIGLIAAAALRADLARRLEIESHLVSAQERWTLTVQQLPLSFIEWNLEAEIIAWNPAAERIFGFTSEEVGGRKGFGFIVPHKVREAVDEVWKDVVAATGGTHSINENITKDGRLITCEWFNTPIRDSAGSVVGVMSLTQDITERVNLENEARKSQKLQSIGRLAAGIAHDFNNILTIVQGHADLLLNRRDLPPDVLDDLDRIATAAERAANLTRQLLTFSRRQVMIQRPLDINETVASMTMMLTRALGEDITLQCDLAPSVPLIEADTGMMEQLVMNLSLNARDAMPQGGTLSISSHVLEVDEADVQRNPEKRKGSAVCISVADTGCGMDSEKLTHLFEPFFTTKDVGSGLGLGLAAVHGIVKQHKGWIEVASQVNKGTTVEVFFPAAVFPELPQAGVAAQETSTPPSATILLVEDEPAVRKLAAIVLERRGFRVLEAEDGVDAERVWNEHEKEIDILLTDIVMPNGISGRDLAKTLLARKAGLKVIFASGYSIDFASPDFAANDGSTFIQKPYLPKQLIQIVEKCMGAEA